MGMTPIHRIPMEGDSPSLNVIVHGELDNRSTPDLQGMLADLISHDSDTDSAGICMDWAMQIRMELGISWQESIDAAMILFYG